MVTLKVEIDQSLHKELKLLAAKENKKIKEILIEAIRKYIKGKKKVLNRDFLKYAGIIKGGEIPEIIMEIFRDSIKVKRIWER